MPRDMRKTFEKLRAVAPQFIIAADKIDELVCAAETALREISLGVFAQADPFQGQSYLGYGRAAKECQFYITTTIDGICEKVPWSACPREMRLQAFMTFPQLLEKIADRAIWMAGLASKVRGTCDDLEAVIGGS